MTMRPSMELAAGGMVMTKSIQGLLIFLDLSLTFHFLSIFPTLSILIAWPFYFTPLTVCSSLLLHWCGILSNWYPDNFLGYPYHPDGFQFAHSSYIVSPVVFVPEMLYSLLLIYQALWPQSLSGLKYLPVYYCLLYLPVPTYHMPFHSVILPKNLSSMMPF